MLLFLKVGLIAFSTVCLSVFFHSLSDFVFFLLTLHHRLVIGAIREKRIKDRRITASFLFSVPEASRYIGL